MEDKDQPSSAGLLLALSSSFSAAGAEWGRVGRDELEGERPLFFHLIDRICKVIQKPN